VSAAARRRLVSNEHSVVDINIFDAARRRETVTVVVVAFDSNVVWMDTLRAFAFHSAYQRRVVQDGVLSLK
jgi:hypothetical protein